MEPERNYLMVGVFVIATVIAGIFFAIWLVGSGGDKNDIHYRIRFAESVNGLVVGGPVKFRGVEVGKVDTIAIDQNDTRLIRVGVRIGKETPVKTDTVASLNLQGITGAAYVELTGGSPNAPNLVDSTPDGKVPEIRAESSSFSAIVNRAPELLDHASKVAEQAGKLLSDDNVTQVSEMVQHGNNFATTLDAQSKQLQEVLATTNALLRDMRDITRSSKDDIRSITTNLNASARQINELATRTNGAAGGGYEELYQLEVELKNTSRELGALAKSLNAEPSRLITQTPDKGIPTP